MRNTNEDSYFYLQNAVLYIEENASRIDYSPEALDHLKVALLDVENAFRKLEQIEGIYGTYDLSDGTCPRIFFDMDGTLSQWEDNPIEVVAKPGYFYNRKPVLTMVDALRKIQNQGSYEVYVLSSVFVDDHSVNEKIAWNALYTGVPKSHQIYVPYGQDKQDYLAQFSPVNNWDILVDDFSYNLHQWKGKGIKVYNGVNGTKGSWKGAAVRNSFSADMIAEYILDAAHLLERIADN